jgi:hypothetical protein
VTRLPLRQAKTRPPRASSLSGCSPKSGGVERVIDAEGAEGSQITVSEVVEGGFRHVIKQVAIRSGTGACQRASGSFESHGSMTASNFSELVTRYQGKFAFRRANRRVEQQQGSCVRLAPSDSLKKNVRLRKRHGGVGSLLRNGVLRMSGTGHEHVSNPLAWAPSRPEWGAESNLSVTSVTHAKLRWPCVRDMPWPSSDCRTQTCCTRLPSGSWSDRKRPTGTRHSRRS